MSGALDEEPLGGGDAGSGASGAVTTSAGSSGSSSGASNSGGNAAGGSGPISGSGSGNVTPTGGTAAGGANGSAGSNAGGTPSAGGSGGTGAGGDRACKRGIGWHGASLTNAEVSSKITWWYTWGLSVQSVGAGLEFTPMVWGGGAKLADVTLSAATPNTCSATMSRTSSSKQT